MLKLFVFHVNKRPIYYHLFETSTSMPLWQWRHINGYHLETLKIIFDYIIETVEFYVTQGFNSMFFVEILLSWSCHFCADLCNTYQTNRSQSHFNTTKENLAL